MERWTSSMLVLVLACTLHQLCGVQAQCSSQCKAGSCQGSTCYSCNSTFYVLQPSGICSQTCSPPGKSSFILTCSTATTFCGQVCDSRPPVTGAPANTQTSTASPGSSGLSSTILGVIIGASVGVVIIAGGIAFVWYYVHSRRELALQQASTHVNMRELRQAPSNSNLRRPAERGEAESDFDAIEEEESGTAAQGGAEDGDVTAAATGSGDKARLAPSQRRGGPPPAAAVPLSDEERELFFAKLAEIRPNAATLLEILNATNRVRRHTQDAAEAGNLKHAMDDMAAVLRLVHRKTKSLAIPANGLHLVTWSAGLVSSYRQSQGQGEEVEGV